MYGSWKSPDQLCSYSPFQFQNLEVRISPNYAQVGEVLRIFCEDLEEQIQHRRYFYKSSSLVHEGMIVVHNSGLTGDTTSATVSVVIVSVVDITLFIENLCWASALSKQAHTRTTLCPQVEIDRRMLDFCVGLDTEFSEIVEGSHLYFPKTKFDSVSHTPSSLLFIILFTLKVCYYVVELCELLDHDRSSVINLWLYMFKD